MCNLENDLYILLDWAYHQKLKHISMASPSSRFFCIGRGGSRNPNVSGRIMPDIEQSQTSENQVFSPMSMKIGDEDFDEIDPMMKNTQSTRLAEESKAKLSKLFNVEEITPSRAFEDTLPTFLFDLWHIVTSICNKFPQVLGGMISLEDVININKYTSAFEVEVCRLRLTIFIEPFHPNGGLRSHPRAGHLPFENLLPQGVQEAFHRKPLNIILYRLP